jgi:hypothetical protein
VIAENVAAGIYLTGGVQLVAERVRFERNFESVLAFNVRSISIRDSTAVAHVDAGLDFIANGGNAVDVVLDRVVVTDSGYMGINAFATGSGSNIALALTRSTIVHNDVTTTASGAIRANTAAAGSTQVTIEDTVVQRNLGAGVLALNAGTRVTLSNSSVVGNGGFGLNNSSATLYTRGTNTIRGNNGMELTSQTTGTITPLGGS